MATSNDVNRIVFWGPSRSGKTWLFKAFLKKIQLLNDKLTGDGFEIKAQEKTTNGVWEDVRNIDGLTHEPTQGLTETLYRIVKKKPLLPINGTTNQNLRFLSDRVNIQSHEVLLIDNAGGLFQRGNRGTINQNQVDQALAKVHNASYIILALNSGDTTTGQGSLAEDLRELSGILQGTRGKRIAACITKVDELGQSLIISLYNRNKDELQGLLARSFGRQYAEQIKAEINVLSRNHEVELFATSSSGYYDENGKKVKNINSTGYELASVPQWNPEEVEKPFFWLFGQIERERLAYLDKDDKVFSFLMQKHNILAARKEAYVSYEQLIRLAETK